MEDNHNASTLNPQEHPSDPVRASASQGSAQYNFEFNGLAGEFFRIWIVNLLLTIVTLGIYSAWAKVRTKRYLFGSTSLAGSTFDYTADPIRILKGRIIAVVALVAYQVIANFFPQFGGIALLAIMSALPAAIVMSMRFSNINTTWRNIRFGFNTNYSAAYKLFTPVILYFAFLAALPFIFDLSVLLDPESMEEGDAEAALASLTPYFAITGGAAFIAMLAFPAWQSFYYRFIAKESRFGRSEFSLDTSTGAFYKIYFGAFGVTVGLIFIVGILIAASAGFAIALAGFLVFGFYIFIWAYIVTRRTNLVFSNIRIKDTHFLSDLELGKMIYLYVTNSIAILLTLGLAIPWAKIRTVRYRASRMQVFSVDLDEFTRHLEDDQNALGEEVGDFFGLDLGL